MKTFKRNILVTLIVGMMSLGLMNCGSGATASASSAVTSGFQTLTLNYSYQLGSSSVEITGEGQMTYTSVKYPGEDVSQNINCTISLTDDELASLDDLIDGAHLDSQADIVYPDCDASAVQVNFVGNDVDSEFMVAGCIPTGVIPTNLQALLDGVDTLQSQCLPYIM